MSSQDPEKLRSRRRLLLVALLALFLLLGVGVAAWLATGPKTIRPGMTREEVEARLGPPDGNMIAVGGTAIQDNVLVWKDREIVITFDADHRVREVSRPPSLFDNLRNKIGF